MTEEEYQDELDAMVSVTDTPRECDHCGRPATDGCECEENDE